MKKLFVGCCFPRAKRAAKPALGGVLLVTGVVMAMGARAAELPAGYTAVDHIVAPRGAYVDTGYRPNQNTHVVMDVTVQGLNEYWFGCWDEAYNKGAFALGNDDRLGVYYAVGNDGGSVKSDKGVDGLVSKGRHAVEITPYSFLVDGVEWMAKGRQGDFRLLNNLYLFAQNRKGTPVPGEYQHDVVCHGCTISEGETPKRDFVPCVRMADAVAGFYDTVEGKFYGNLGSGTFGASDDRLPLGRELTSGTYEITESFAFAAPMGESALKIADGATVTLNISAGVIVAVRGGDAVGTMGAGAGIEVPANATLKVTGAGKLVAYGGKAANGADGHAGQNGSASQVQGRFESGGGGWGGNGGGGAGAGIGGRGGVGGEGGASGPQVVGRDWSYTDIAGTPGKIGGNGGIGGTCGSVSVEDFVTVLAYGGAAGAADGAGGASGQWAWLEGDTYYFGGFGGGGGGSGARGGAAQDIGGGGGGGFGGGGGGSGGYLSRFKWNTFKEQPAWGVGGLGAANGAAGGATSGFLPAFHGVSGARGGSGSLMIANGAAVRAAEGRYSVGRLSETVEIVYDKGKLLWVSEGTSNNLSYSVVSYSTGKLGNGWYVVNGTVSRKQPILVSGAANLVLLHNSSLTVDCGGISREREYAPGIEVCDDNSLCVFGTETGVLTAIGSKNAAGIGTAMRFNGKVWNCNSCGSIAFYGGTVTATGGHGSAGVGGGDKGAGGTVTINGGSVTAFGDSSAAAIGGGDDGADGSLTLGRRVFKIDDNHWREGLGVSFVIPADLRVSSARADRTWTEENRLFALVREAGREMTFTFEVTDPACRLVGDASLTVGPVFSNRELESSLLPHAEEIVLDALDYVLPNGEVRRAKSVYPIHSRADVSVLSQTWYRVTGDLTRSELVVVGEVNLILCDGASLTVNGGIRVGEGNAFNVFCQEGGTGRLVAVGSESYAGIGGGAKGAGGVVTINGGTVTAMGSSAGAGIGGGYEGAGGTVTINGGTVTAQSGYSGAGIGGGGWGGAGGTVTINGGTVTATGRFRGAGIGGGQDGAGGVVTINGGTVTATGGNSERNFGGGGAGIGGGDKGAGGVVTINGGMVTATGGAPGAAGIGGGNAGVGGKVAVTGGTVVADGSAGLGGTATIDGGCIKAKSIPEQPKNTAGMRLYKVTVNGLEGLVSLEGLEGYGKRDICPIDGCIYLYLPDGEHSLRVTSGGVTKSASFVVMGDDVNIVLAGTGKFFVNGEDFGMGAGTGWARKDNRLVLSTPMSYVLSGTVDGYGIEITGDATVVLSNATITTSGSSALSVADGKSVRLQMAGLASYLFATNASAIALGNAAELTVGSAPGADRLAEIVAVSYGDDVIAISGATASTEVESGNFLVKSDVQAAEGAFGISVTPACPLLMKTGPSPDRVRFSDAYNHEAFVGVVRSYAIAVPAFEGVASVVVSNDVEELKGKGGVYRAMLTEEVTIDFTAADGYDIVSGGHLYIPSLTNDVTIGDEGHPRPDVRRKLTVSLPEVEGFSAVVVTEGGEEVGVKGKAEGMMVYPVRSGYDVEIACTAQKGWRIVSETNVVVLANIQENKVLTAAELPQAWRLFTVKVPEMENARCILTSTDDLRTVTSDGSELILSNSEVTVTFVAVGNWRITANGEKTWTLTGDVTFGTTEGFPLPTFEGIPGTEADPWQVGADVVAYTNATGELTIVGTGAMDDFASAADVPWDSDAVTSAVVDERVTKVGANAFVALAGNVLVNGLPSSQFRSISPGFMSDSSLPSGAISPAEFERIDIIDGKALLDVSVYTSNTLTNENWSVATNGIIEVPAPGKQGFFILKSKPAVPSDETPALMR